MEPRFGRGLHAPPDGRLNPEAYDRYVGYWSGLFTRALLAAADIGPGAMVLDIAAGLGEAALAALPLIAPSGLMVGTDISEPMIGAAQTRLDGRPFHPVVADGQALPFAAGSFDAVVCQLGLQFFPDPVSGLAEARRVLRPGGRASVCVIGQAERAPMWGFLAEALSRELPDHRQTLQLSFSLADPTRLRDMFKTAGFHDIAVRREAREGNVGGLDAYWAAIEAGTGSLPQAYSALPRARRLAVRRAVTKQLLRNLSAGRLVMSLETLIASGRA